MRLLVRVLQGTIPRAFASIEEFSPAAPLPVRGERLYLIGRSEHKLESRAVHAESDVALGDYWRLRVTEVVEVPASVTLLRAFCKTPIIEVQFTAGEELLEAKDARISSHSRVELRQELDLGCHHPCFCCLRRHHVGR